MIFLRFSVANELYFIFSRCRIGFTLGLNNFRGYDQIAADIANLIIFQLHTVEQVAIGCNFSSNHSQLCSPFQPPNLCRPRIGLRTDIDGKFICFSNKRKLHCFFQSILSIGNRQIIRQHRLHTTKQHNAQPQAD